MGARTNQPNALLVFVKRFKYWILMFLGVTLLLELSLSYLNHVQQQSTWKSVASLLRNEVNSSNSYQISRALSDMEQEGWIKCVRLTETTNDRRVFYDTTSQSYCGTFASKTQGELTSINGSTWNMSFASPENLWLHAMRVLLPCLLILIQVLLFNYLEKQRRIQDANRLRLEIEKDFLLDLTKQTKHDIASPIGALRMVVKRLEVPVEYSEMLQQIVERIDGIFNQLKDAADSDYSKTGNQSLAGVSLDRLVKQIVQEKIDEWNLPYESFELKLIPTFVFANEIELGRVISNILNNSIEAAKDGIPVKILIESQIFSNMCLLKVQDNGKGISEDNRLRVGTKGFSFGKREGAQNMGLGVYSAAKTISSFGGSFEIYGVEGAGAIVKIALKIQT